MSHTPARLSQLLEAAGVTPLAPWSPDAEVLGVAVDSRCVAGGEVFFALTGQHGSGEAFADDAVRRGVRAVVARGPRPAGLAERVAWVQVQEPRLSAGLVAREWHGRPDTALTLVGVTGTNGKTTVTFLVEHIARAAGCAAGRIGTVGWSRPGACGAAQRTTPEAPELYGLLAQMRAAGVTLVALEVSSHALSLHRVAGARFAVAAFLNLGRDHLDFHGDLERYFEAKAALFDELGPTQHAVLPADSDVGRRLASRTRARVVTFGRSAAAHFRLREETIELHASSAILDTPSGSVAVRTPLVGRFNLENVAAAAACAAAAGLPLSAVPSGVAALAGVPGRVERVTAGQPFAVLVDYAHTEAALAGLLDALRPLARGRLIVLFGCGGERDRGKRAPMGRVAAATADRIYVTSDNPRNEDPRGIIAEIVAGVAEIDGGLERCRAIEDRREAIAAALAEARAGDVVVLAGKGHEDRVTVGRESLPLDDRVVARETLARLGFGGVVRA